MMIMIIIINLNIRVVMIVIVLTIIVIMIKSVLTKQTTKMLGASLHQVEFVENFEGKPRN